MSFFVIDLERHNDGEDGLVGPFMHREDAEGYIATIPDDHQREYATIRPMALPTDSMVSEFERGGHHFRSEPGCRSSIRLLCLDCGTFQLAFNRNEVEPLIARHLAKHLEVDQ